MLAQSQQFVGESSPENTVSSFADEFEPAIEKRNDQERQLNAAK